MSSSFYYSHSRGPLLILPGLQTTSVPSMRHSFVQRISSAQSCVGQEHAINAKIKAELVPKLLFEELSQITPPGLKSPPLAFIASSSYQPCNSSPNLFCLRQHQLFHT